MSKLLLTLVLPVMLAACASAPTRPSGWSAPETVVAPSSFAGVHGLAIDRRGRLLAGSVVGSSMWEVDRRTGAARVFIPAPQGQADDIAIGPHGELAWTSFMQGVLRMRASDDAPIRVLAKDLPGINSLDFDRRTGKLYASQVFLGDALWEIDVAGAKPPRLIAKDLGGLNGFEVGADGMIYGPLWFKQRVVKIDPATGAITTINSEFQIPAAANLDGHGGLWVVDAKTGELSRVDLATGAKKVAKTLKPALDNLAIAPEGTIYVSNMADNSVEAFEPATGEVRVLTSGKVPVAGGMRLEGDHLWVAGIFAVREVDVTTGSITDERRMWASDINYPTAVSVSAQHVVLASPMAGLVQQIDRASRKTVNMGAGFKTPIDVIAEPGGSVLVSEMAAGRIVRASGPGFKQRQNVAEGLQGPGCMTLGRDGALFVADSAGAITRVNLADGSKTTVASGLQGPWGIAQTPWGSLIVLEAGDKRLTEIDLATGERRTVATGLAVGSPSDEGKPPAGVAVDRDGNVYVGANATNAIYKFRPVR